MFDVDEVAGLGCRAEVMAVLSDPEVAHMPWGLCCRGDQSTRLWSGGVVQRTLLRSRAEEWRGPGAGVVDGVLNSTLVRAHEKCIEAWRRSLDWGRGVSERSVAWAGSRVDA